MGYSVIAAADLDRRLTRAEARELPPFIAKNDRRVNRWGGSVRHGRSDRRGAGGALPSGSKPGRAHGKGPSMSLHG